MKNLIDAIDFLISKNYGVDRNKNGWNVFDNENIDIQFTNEQDVIDFANEVTH